MRTKGQERLRNQRPAGVLRILRGNAKRRGLSVEITAQDFKQWYDQEHICFYCGQILVQGNPRKTNSLTIERLNNDKGYTIDNIALACHQCNRIRSDFFTVEEMLGIAEKYIKPKRKANGI